MVRGIIRPFMKGVGEVARGVLLSEPGVIAPGFMLNVSILMLPWAGLPLKNRQKVKFYPGTSITSAIVVLMGEKAWMSGIGTEDTAVKIIH